MSSPAFHLAGLRDAVIAELARRLVSSEEEPVEHVRQGQAFRGLFSRTSAGHKRKPLLKISRLLGRGCLTEKSRGIGPHRFCECQMA
jgi:hypothetical protein